MILEILEAHTRDGPYTETEWSLDDPPVSVVVWRCLACRYRQKGREFDRHAFEGHVAALVEATLADEQHR